MNKSHYTKIFLKELGKNIDDDTITEYISDWWQNTRNKDEGGLRLTDRGFEMITSLNINTYEIPFPQDMNFTSQIFIYLDKFIDCPYYFTKKSIFVTNEKKAIELVLFSGDIRKYGMVKALTRIKNLEKNG